MPDLDELPQDIEWAIENDRLYILQKRPITQLCFGGIEGEWTNADFRDGGVAGASVAPLMWSLYEFIWEGALKGYLANLRLLDGDFPASRVLYGRPYWNLGAVKRCAVKLPGFIESEFDRDLGVRPKYAGDGIRTPASLWNLIKALRTVLAARRTMTRQDARDRQLLGSDWPRKFDVDVEGLDDERLLCCFRQLVEQAYRTIEENYFRTIFCVSIAKLDFKRALGNLPLSYPALVGGLDRLAHFECAQALWEFANQGEGACPTLARFLARYGHHSRRELDLRIPRWSEEGAFVEQLASKLVGTESPEDANRRQRRRYAAELERARGLLSPWRRKRFEEKLLQLRSFLWLREQMRDLSTRTYARIRRFALEIGRRAAAAGRLRSADDIFYLTFREAYQVLDGSHHEIVESRRDYELMYRRFRPANEVGRGHAHAPVEQAGKRLIGIGCSTGIISGRVRVVMSLAEAEKLERGDILVTPFADPGWTPLLSIAAGVVTETGGLLSHAAVICREYAIPAVLNVPAATRLLRDDHRVRIHGEMGYVDIL
jgi:pyruvate,water dikinase